MNRSFRSIWNASLGAWVAVSEVSRAGRGGRAVASSLVVACALVAPAGAATLYWDINGNTAGLGGTGTWNTTNAFWNSNSTGTGGTVSAWTNGSFDDAVFGGTGGPFVVTVGGTMDVRNITTSASTSNYTLAGGTLNLGGTTTPTITVTGPFLIVSSNIAGGGFTKTGNTMQLTGTNTWAGTVTVSGALQVGNGGATGTLGTGAIVNNGILSFNRSGTLIATNDISGSGTVSLTAANGTTILTGSNSYTGTTTISGGTLQIGNGGTTGTLGTGSVNISGAANSLTFNRSDTLTFANATSGSGRITMDGSGTVIRTGNTTSSGGLFLNAGTWQVATSAQLGISGGITFNGGTLKNTGFFGTGRAIALTGNGTFQTDVELQQTGVISGGGQLIKTGAGTLTLRGANTYSGTTRINAGTLQVGNGGTTGTLGTAGVVNNANLTFNRSNTMTVANAISGTGTVTQLGTGTTVLSGTNTYSGATTVNAGTLQAGGAAGGQAFGLNSAVTLADVAGATLDLNGFNQTVGSLAGGGTTGGNVTLGTGTLTTGGNNTSTAYAGVISGTGGLTKNGTGTQMLTGANTYTGTTTISAGTLQVGDGGTSGTLGTGAVTNNASLIFNRADTLTVANAINGTGSLTQAGAGKTILTGNSAAFAGTTSVEAGTLAVNGSLCGTMNVRSGGTLQGTGRVCDTTNFTGGTIAPGNSIGTLLIAGNYAGNGGVLQMEGQLAGTGSPADRLLITGNATGTTEVRVINTLAGGGAVTGTGNTDGISIIQVGGTSAAGTFQLQGGYAAAGPYQYRLNFFAPGASAAAQADPLLGTAVFGDYRLQSAVDASGAPIPVPQVGGYQAMPTGALRYGSSLLNGLHARLGEIRRLQSTPGAMEDGLPQKEVFLREQTSRTDFSGDRGPSYDQDVDFVQVGGNLVKWDIGETGSTLRIGGALSFGTSKLSVKGSSAKVDLKGSTLALMSTYQGAGGKYIDVLAQGTRYRANVRTSERGTVGDPKGWGVGLSVEGGYPFEVGERLTLEPQAQLAYQRVRFDRFTDVDNITVDLENGNSLRGRVGVRLQSIYEARGQQWSPYAEVNLLHEFLKGATVQASGVGFRSDSGGTGLQFGAGLNARLARNATLFLKLGYEKGIGKGTANTWSGTLGVRMSF